MFTGLVEGIGYVQTVTRKGPDAVLGIKAPFGLAEVELGDSIAVSGACLTVTGMTGQTFQTDVSAETLSRTGLGRLKTGSPVNVERALRLGDRLGGHLVSGHIDCQGTMLDRTDVGASIVFRFRLPEEVMRYVIAKGSITIDGISLTVNEVGRDWFAINVIPHTADKTTLGLKKPGEMVNIETDLIGKYVESLLGPFKTRDEGISMDRLGQLGFFNK